MKYPSATLWPKRSVDDTSTTTELAEGSIEEARFLVASDDVTALLNAWSAGDPGAEESLFRVVYPELRRLADRRLGFDPPRPTLQATELVNEAYLRLVDQNGAGWSCRAQFFALAATMIRRILIDRARSRLRRKRGAGAIHLSLESLDLANRVTHFDLLALDLALTELAQVRATTARIVELRFFAGLDVEQTAAVLHVGTATVIRQWRFAKAWLAERLAGRS